jgi:hypothetical protein
LSPISSRFSWTGFGKGGVIKVDEITIERKTKCQNCGAEVESLIKHHVSYRPERIELWCSDCHKSYHGRLRATNHPTPRACPLWYYTDHFQAYDHKDELRLEDGKCPVPALIAEMELLEGDKIIEVSCCEFYRRYRHLFESKNSIFIKAPGVSDDYRDCQFYSEWFFKKLH